MPYRKFANSGRTFGKIMFELQKLAVPVTLIQHLTFQGNGVIVYDHKPFAKYTWSEDNSLFFTFDEKYKQYTKVENDEHSNQEVTV